MTPQDEMAELLGLKLEADEVDEASPPGTLDDEPVTEPAPPGDDPVVEPEEDLPIAAEVDEKPVEGEAPVETKPAPGASDREAKLRREARQRESLAAQRVAPAPTSAPVADAAPKPAGIPVKVSADGQQVYVDPAELAQFGYLTREQVAEAMKPTPEQMAAMAEQRAVQGFIAEKPNHAEVFRTAQQAGEYLKLALAEAIQSHGYQPMTAADLITVAREAGVADQVAEYFPVLAPHLDEFIEALTDGTPAWRANVLRRIAASAQTAEDAPESRPALQAKPVLRSVKNAPQSLARKGGARTEASGDVQEFEGLERRFRADQIFFPPADLKRLKELGTKLRKSGYV
jgi:hypothetical protein